MQFKHRLWFKPTFNQIHKVYTQRKSRILHRTEEKTKIKQLMSVGSIINPQTDRNLQHIYDLSNQVDTNIQKITPEQF